MVSFLNEPLMGTKPRVLAPTFLSHAFLESLIFSIYSLQDLYLFKLGQYSQFLQ